MCRSRHRRPVRGSRTRTNPWYRPSRSGSESYRGGSSSFPISQRSIGRLRGPSALALPNAAVCLVCSGFSDIVPSFASKRLTRHRNIPFCSPGSGHCWRATSRLTRIRSIQRVHLNDHHLVDLDGWSGGAAQELDVVAYQLTNVLVDCKA